MPPRDPLQPLANNARRLISTRALLYVLLLTLVLLWLVFPRSFSEREGPASRVTEAFLRAEQSHRPQDRDLMLKRALHLVELLDFEQAVSVLKPLLTEQNAQAKNLMRRIQFHAWSSFEGIDKQQIASTLRESILALSIEDITPYDLEIAKALNMDQWLVNYYTSINEPLVAAKISFANENHKKGLSILRSHLSEKNAEAYLALAKEVGAHNTAINWLLTYPQYFIKNNYYDDLLSLSLNVGRNDLLALPRKYFPKNFNGRENWLEQAIKSRIALGELDEALILIDEKLSANPSDLALRELKTKVLNWTSRSSEALNEREWLFNQTNDHAHFHELVKAFDADYQYEKLIRICQSYTQDYTIDDTTMAIWMNAHARNGSPEQAITDLKRYERRHGENTETLSWLIKHSSDISDSQSMRLLWPRYRDSMLDDGVMQAEDSNLAKASKRVDNATLGGFARAFIVDRDYPIASEILKLMQPDELNEDDQIDYWNLRLKVAQASANKDFLLLTYSELFKRGKLEDWYRPHWLSLRFGQDSIAQINWYWQQYEGQPSLELLYSVSSLLTPKLDDHYLRLEKALQNLPMVKNAAQLWLQLGNHHFSQNRLPSAERCFEMALQLDPDMSEAYRSLGWLKLEQKS